jgi:hypothetical protein
MSRRYGDRGPVRENVECCAHRKVRDKEHEVIVEVAAPGCTPAASGAVARAVYDAAGWLKGTVTVRLSENHRGDAYFGQPQWV